MSELSTLSSASSALTSIAQLDAYRKFQLNDPAYPEFMRSFYAPHDDVHGVLKRVIGSTQRSLVIAMYGYDDDELAEMIAHILENDDIFVQITLDKSQAGGVHERELLAKYKAYSDANRVAIGTSERGAIMHRKMVIVDGIWRITGSTNWSDAGETKQDNELTVVQSVSACNEARHILDLEHEKARTQMQKALDKAAA
jgi:phosphatidylserine/phosphatidylglycerophosphate/cardiolipin synthase-like enzyme